MFNRGDGRLYPVEEGGIDRYAKVNKNAAAFTIPYLEVEATCECTNSTAKWHEQVYQLVELKVTFGAIVYLPSAGPKEKLLWLEAAEYDHVADYRRWDFTTGRPLAALLEYVHMLGVYMTKGICEETVGNDVRDELMASLEKARQESRDKYDKENGPHTWEERENNDRSIPDDPVPSPASIVNE